MDGILIVNKKKNMTSRDVVDLVGKKLNTKKIGHTGTLDPIASGVLVLTIGKATKISELLTSCDKEYIATVKLGIKTDTLDVTGTILKKEDVSVSEEQIKEALNSLIGFYDQEVPLYSAVKIKGKKLYEYAREKVDVDLPKRKVEIKSLELISDIKDNTFKIKCLVSKGTYIRSLINDIALKLNTIGVMEDLKRTKQGDFKLEEAVSLDDVSFDKIIPLEKCLNNYYMVDINDDDYFKIKNGMKIDNIYHEDVVVFKYQNKVVAIYRKDNNKLRPWKMFISN